MSIQKAIKRNNKSLPWRPFRILTQAGLILGLVFLLSAEASAALTVTPSSWNIVGLDSNTPAFGPNRFPVGAKVCGGTSGAVDTAAFAWDTGGTDDGTYIYLRAGSANPVSITFGADGCADAYFEVEVKKDANAFDLTRRYHITAGGASTPTPRELYVEHLISQSRNSISNIELDGVLIPAGGAMNLVVGKTYTIKLFGGTATQGYNQFEAFINFPNTIFQVLSVSTDYSANDSPFVSTTGHKYLYADACGWEDDPDSPYYVSCTGGDYKAGGSNVVTTYTVKILGGGGTQETLNTLLYDFSGSSFHYNADYAAGARFANIIDPAAVTISKSFGPNPTNAGGVSTLTFTLTNPNAGIISGMSFTDGFPTSPGALVVDAAPNASTSGCGTPTFSPAAGAGAVSFSNGTIAANSSCIVLVDVSPPVTGSYVNTTGHLFVGALDTGKTAGDTLMVNTTPPPPPPSPSCGVPVELAAWSMPTSGQGSGGPPPPYTSKATDVATASAIFTSVSGTNMINASGYPANGWGGTAPTGGNGWGETATSMNNYFQFLLDASKYGGIYMTFDGRPDSAGDWANPNSNVFINTSTNGSTWTAYTPAPQAGKNAWTSLNANLGLTGSTTTYIRLGVDGSGNNKTGAAFYLDNVRFIGCTIPDPNKLTLDKGFSPTPVAVNGTSTLTFTLSNLNSGSTSTLTNIRFTDTLVSGLTVTTGSSTQCGGTLSKTAPSTISFTGGALAPGANCTVAALVTATTAGPHNNVSGYIYSAESGTNATASGSADASLTAVSPPVISKQFAPSSIISDGTTTSTLTFMITNPNQNDVLSSATFTDIFPASPGAMKVAASPNASASGCGSPTFAPAADATSISFSNGTIPAAGTCTIKVDITLASNGTYTNTSGNVSHVINSDTVNGNTATATMAGTAAHPAIGLLKQVSTSATGPWMSYVALQTGANVYYRFTIENLGDVPLNPATVTDPTLAGTPADPAGCAWTNPLPVASASQDPTETCVRGPVAAVLGVHSNTATAHGTYGGTVYDSTPSLARYATTGLVVTKSAAQTHFTKTDDVLNYSYPVTNSGSATLIGPVTVTDDKAAVTCPALTTIGNLDSFLQSGETVTCTAAYTVAAADVTAKQVTNLASAATAADGVISGVTTTTVSKTVPLAPEFSATKTNNAGGQVVVGGSFDWTLTVSNAVSAGTATFTNGQVLLVDNLPMSGATYTAPSIATNAGGTIGIIDCPISSGTVTCTANGAVTIPPNGAFSLLITVATSTGGPLVNPRSGGICKANPAGVIPEIDETNNACADTVTVRALPSITAVKSSTIVSDPINGTTSPKVIPGSVLEYTVQVLNSGPGTVDSGTTVVTDPIPANTELVVSDINGAGSGPVWFTQGAVVSGLTYTFLGLGSAGDNVSFSNDNGTTYVYTPAADANNCDVNITNIKINPSGAMNGASGGNNPSFSLKFRMRVK